MSPPTATATATRDGGHGRRVFVIGVGMTRFNKPGDEDYPAMAKESGTKALRDAGIRFGEVQQAVVGYVYGDSTCGQRAVYEIGLSGIPIVNVNNNCSTGSSALFLAKQIVQGGQADCVLALGFEKMQRGSLTSHFNDRTNPLDKHVETMLRSNDLAPNAPVAPQMFGNAGREHIKKYGTSPSSFAKIAVKNHKHSINNPYSQFKDPYSLEQVLASPPVYSPLTKLQCCPTSDGSAAAIVCSESFILNHPNRASMMFKAVEILGMALTTDFESSFKDSCIKMVGFDMSRAAADTAYKQAGLSPNDVQVIELHDCFSANELITYEALGLAPEGQGARLIEDGQVTYGGRWVVNPSGGLISKGHPLGATGLAQCSELCWQLRGQCGKRQVPGAKVALQHNIGLGGAAVVALYRRGWLNATNPNPNEPNAAVDPDAFWTPVSAQKTPEPQQQQQQQPAAPTTNNTTTEGPNIKSAAIFNQIQKRIATEGATLVKKMNGVLVFNITANGKTHVWTVDLKNGNGSVNVGPSVGKADCTFTVTDDNFFALASGKLDPTMAFMSGKLKIQGNTGLAMKLGPLLKSSPAAKTASAAAAPAPAQSGAAPESPQIKSTAVFEQMKKRIDAQGPELVKKMNGILAFNINADGKTHMWTVDLKNGNGSVRVGAPEGKPDCTFTTSDDNFVALSTGKLDPTMAFMGGKLKLQGNMSLAMKLGALLKPQTPKSKL